MVFLQETGSKVGCVKFKRGHLIVLNRIHSPLFSTGRLIQEKVPINCLHLDFEYMSFTCPIQIEVAIKFAFFRLPKGKALIDFLIIFFFLNK